MVPQNVSIQPGNLKTFYSGKKIMEQFLKNLKKGLN